MAHFLVWVSVAIKKERRIAEGSKENTFKFVIIVDAAALKQGLTAQPRLVCSFLCSPNWPGTHNPPASDFGVLKPQVDIVSLKLYILYTYVCVRIQNVKQTEAQRKKYI